MDFDDLLDPSHSALEENPFADPFSKRSNSPDPWASPYTRQDYSSTTFLADQSNITPTVEATGPPGRVAHVSDEVPSTSADPLDSAAVATDEDDEALARFTSQTSPGFRESVISSSFSETATIRPTESEELEPSFTAPIEKVSLPHPVTPPPRIPVDVPVSPSPTHNRAFSRSSVVSPTPSTSRVDPSRGPLEQPVRASTEPSFSDLSIGGESGRGWQGAQEAWSHDRPVSRFPTEDDSDDDKPIGQALKEAEQLRSPPSAQPRKDDGLQPVFVITVDDPQKVGDPIRSFTMYTVHIRTTSPLFQKSAFSVLRRYSDFLWLYETLSANNPGVVVPPVPEKNPFGRFDDQFVRQRRFALEKCIQKIANHPVLGKDPDLKMFLESDTFTLDIKHRKAELANERGGLMASIGQTIAGPRFHETDEWFDRQKAYLDSLESQLRGLVKAIELLSKQRAELAAATGEFAQSASDLSSSDVGTQLAQCLAALAEVGRKSQDVQATQSEQDVVTLLSTVDEYARLINSVRLAFNSRIRTYHAWRTADSDLLRVKQTHERNRAQGRIPSDRLGFSLSQIAEAERRALESKHEFDHVTKLLKSELARFEQERIEDFKNSLHAFLEGMIARQKELIGAWENYQQMLLKRTGGGRGLPPNQNAPAHAISSPA